MRYPPHIGGSASSPGFAASNAATLASSSAREATSWPCVEMLADSWLPRGRVRQYASESASDRRRIDPLTRTWRSSAGHQKAAAAHGLMATSRPLRLPRYV